MNPDPRTALDGVGIKYRPTPRGELEIDCPACGCTRAAVNAASGAFHCLRCGASGHVSALDRLVGGGSYRPAAVPATPKPKRHPVGPKIEHIYHNENGRHIFSVYRQYFDVGPKDMWNHAAPGFTEAQKRDFMTRYIYNLPDVLNAIRFDGLVYIVEGEKCCDALQKHVAPVPVTTNSGGAGKWTDDHSAWFKYVVPADIVILPDNDTKGQQHAEQVAVSLYRTCPSIQIRIVPLPNLKTKQDIADWINK